jgi:phosphatidylglycerol:prolipoprotein diacylglycerol transferase
MQAYPYLTDIVNAIFGTNLQLPLATFGALVAIAILTANYCAKLEFQRMQSIGTLSDVVNRKGKKVPPHELLPNLVVVVVVAGIVGARIFHILEYPSEFIADPSSMLLSTAGLSIYGGFLVGGVAGAFYFRHYRLPLVHLLDAFAPALALGYAIGRIGCQLSGDGDWGVAANMALKPDFLPTWFWAQTYENNVVGEVIAAPGVYPTPLYETVMALMTFAVLWAVRKKHWPAGVPFSIYLVLSGVARLLIERIRINSEYQLFGLSFTQAEFISLCSIVIGVIGAWYLLQREKRSRP